MIVDWACLCAVPAPLRGRQVSAPVCVQRTGRRRQEGFFSINNQQSKIKKEDDMKIVVTSTGCVDYKKKLYFKGDEIELSDKDAKHLLDKGFCEVHRFASFAAPEDFGDGIIARTPVLKDMTVASLKELLDKLEVLYDAKARKDDLIALVEANTKEMTVASLKELLDKLEVLYDAKARKDDLIALVETSTREKAGDY
jgi:hypothetical protein